MPVFGIGMISDDFYIVGIRQVVTEMLKRVVVYSMALGHRCFKWKMLSLSGTKALLFLQLLIAFITRSVVNVRTISNGFLSVSLVTTPVSLEEVCLPGFEVLNVWFNLVASCLDDENEIPLKVIASFSASRFVLLSIPSTVHHILVRSVFWSMVSTKSLHFFRLCTRFWMALFNLGSSGEVGSLLRRSSRLFITSSISAGTCSSWSLWRPVGMWCDAALSRTVRKISSLWQSVGRERLLRAASTSCLCLSQLAFFRFT